MAEHIEIEHSENMPEEELYPFSFFPIVDTGPKYEGGGSESSDTETRAESDEVEAESGHVEDAAESLHQWQEPQDNDQQTSRKLRATKFHSSIFYRLAWWLPCLTIFCENSLLIFRPSFREGPRYYLIDCMLEWHHTWPSILFRCVPLRAFGSGALRETST